MLALPPVALLAVGLYSVFATVAGALIFVIGLGGIVGIGLVTLIVDRASSINLSNGVQTPVYAFTAGWVSGMASFWILFFFKMNFDVAATNYLTWESIMSVVLPQMGLAACGGLVFASLFAFLFRSDMYHAGWLPRAGAISSAWETSPRHASCRRSSLCLCRCCGR